MTKTLIVTNDFPPRPGGIQAFVHNLAIRRPPGSVIVYAPDWPDAAVFDAEQPFPVVRHPTRLMLPVPTVLRRAAGILRAEGCDTVVFGAAAPLGLLAPGLRRAGAERIIGLTHGHEAGWASLPGARRLLRRIGDDVDVLTYLGEYTRRRIAAGISPTAALRMRRLAPGVDETVFRAGVGGAAGDVFAMPCRTRRRGLDVEGLGIVYLEASATGLPVIAGDSGGAPDAVLPGETGLVVDGRSVAAVADAVADLLANPHGAAAMGEKGRSWIDREWRWTVQAQRFAALLEGQE
jgi:hypothetical protein